MLITAKPTIPFALSPARYGINAACAELTRPRASPADTKQSVFKRLGPLRDAFNSISREAGYQKEICELISLPFIGYKLVVDMEYELTGIAHPQYAELLFFTDDKIMAGHGIIEGHGKKVTVTVGKTNSYSNENVKEVEISRLSEIAIKMANYILNRPSAEFGI